VTNNENCDHYSFRFLPLCWLAATETVLLEDYFARYIVHPTRLYEQLADDLKSIIAAGNLRPGDRLPSVRRLASERHLSVSTVLQALRHNRAISSAMPQLDVPNPTRAAPPKNRYRSTSASG